jgi:hypothetical protein
MTPIDKIMIKLALYEKENNSEEIEILKKSHSYLKKQNVLGFNRISSISNGPVDFSTSRYVFENAKTNDNGDKKKIFKNLLIKS